MYPVLFRVGHFSVTTYGVLLATAVFVAGTLFARALERHGHSRDDAWSVVGWALLGGLVGAKLYYVVLQQDLGALFSRGGLVWYGGFIGGAVGAAWTMRRRGLPALRALDALAPAAALGHAIGHVGCLFSGDSYGLPSDLPWAVAFPRGMPPSTAGNLRDVFGVDVPAAIPDGTVLAVHPTMLYSALILAALGTGLWWLLKRNPPAGVVFGAYLVLAGAERFLVEFLRAKDDRFLWGFTTAQAIAIGLFVAGVLLLAWRGRVGEAAATGDSGGQALEPAQARGGAGAARYDPRPGRPGRGRQRGRPRHPVAAGGAGLGARQPGAAGPGAGAGRRSRPGGSTTSRSAPRPAAGGAEACIARRRGPTPGKTLPVPGDRHPRVP